MHEWSGLVTKTGRSLGFVLKHGFDMACIGRTIPHSESDIYLLLL
jgi:hypothetical protein